MTTQQLADQLVDYCRTGRNDQAYRDLFSADAVAHEPPGIPDNTTRGRAALLAKSAAWADDVAEVLRMEVTDPVVYGDYFALGMGGQLRKKDGTVTPFEREMCIYTCADGKIISERFVYKLPAGA